MLIAIFNERQHFPEDREPDDIDSDEEMKEVHQGNTRA